MSTRISYLVILLFWLVSPQSNNGQGGVASYPAGSEPVCDQSKRGSLVLALGTAGRGDVLEVCLRDGVGRFAWVAANPPNRNSFLHTRKVAGCPIFPDNNIWNSTADKLPVSPESAGIIATYTANRLGTVPAFTLNIADSKTPAFAPLWDSRESDSGKYPITGNMRMEGFTYGHNTVSAGPYPGTDSHLLVLQSDQCKLYEIFGLGSNKPPYHAASGAIYDLMTNSLRPEGWTSADAAGLPIWPAILTYAELYGDAEIRHMIRFTVNATRNTYVWPARHYASRKNDINLPPMGSRWRLKASVDEAVCRQNDNSGKPYPPEMRKLIKALKMYGMILADNGLAIRICTDADSRWGNPATGTGSEYTLNLWTHCLTGRDFEVVDASSLMVSPDSAEISGQ